ncbi:MAG: hypothetical protein U5S82_02120 [Gammaproteobacteria bacterium]|nr:hypothetical protein [Gammaproteobacteria bacterium]
MMGLLVLGALLIYGLIALAAAGLAARAARRRGVAGWKWGLPAALVVYFLVFQDHLPSVALHAWQCRFGDAGFRVYKTIDQWRAENPGVWETLVRDALPEEYLQKTKPTAGNGEKRFYMFPDGAQLVADFWAGGKLITTRLTRPDGTKGYWLNQRFIALSEETRGWFHVYRWEEEIVDGETGEVMARYVDYRSIVRLPAFAYLRVGPDSCESDVRSRIAFSKFQKEFVEQGG